MIKEKTITVSKTVKHYFCDDCGKKINDRVNNCLMCNKHLCRKCIYMTVNDFSDYPDRLCKNCTEVYKQYTIKKDRLEDEIDKLYDGCKLECINNRKNVN